MNEKKDEKKRKRLAASFVTQLSFWQRRDRKAAELMSFIIADQAGLLSI